MASNNYLNANVVPSSDTFREWLDLTNRITYDMEKVVVSTVANTQGACTSGNAYVNGFFSANTVLVEGELKGVTATGSVYGTKAAAANLSISTNSVFVNTYAFVTSNSTINNFVVGQLTATQNSTSNNIAISSSLNQFQSNAIVNDFNSNVDIDAASVTVDGGTIAIGSILDQNANVDIDAGLVDIAGGNTNVSSNLTINSTATTFTSNAATNIFNTPLDINANVDVDAGIVDIAGGNTNVSSNLTINSTATTFTSNAGTNIFNTKIDANANLDIDAALVDIAGGNVISSSNVSITGVNTSITSTKIVLGDATTDDLTVGADSVFSGNVQVTGGLVDVDQDLNVDGDVTLNANLVIGSNNSDGANVQSLIVSSIEPSANGKVLGHADRRWAAALTIANTSGDITAGADVDITGEVNAATAAIVGGATVGGDITLSGDLDGANNKEANVFNAVIRNDLTVTNNTVLNANVTANSAKNFIIGNSSYTAFTSNVSSNVKTIQIGGVADSNNRLTLKSVVGTSSFGLMPLHGNNIALGNTTNRWIGSFVTANTSGAFTSTGDITGGADIDITGEANTATLRVRTTTNMGGKLTISSDGAAITGAVDLVNTINVGANVGMTTAHMLVKGTAAVGNTIANSSVVHVGNATVNTHISKAGIDTDGTLVVQKPTTLSNTVASGNTTITGFAAISGNMKAASANVSGHSNVATLGATGAVDLDSTLTVEGLTNLKGSVDLGDATSDTVSFTSRVDTSIEPSASGKILGHASRRWAAAFTDANTSGDLTVGDDINMSPTGNIIFSNSGISANATTLSSNNFVVDHLQVGVSATLPDDTTLTASSLGSANLVITNAAKFTGAATAGTGNNVIQIGNGANTVVIDLQKAVVNNSIIAGTDNSFDVGNTTTGAFRSGYFDTKVKVGTTVANTTALLADFVYAKQDLIANYSSDQQLKDNVLKIDTALDKVNSLGGYSFTWNNNIGDMRAGTPDYGVIAQELEDVLPHAVDINSRGYKTVNYNSLIPLLIEAVKELTERVKELEPDIEEPEEEIDG